MNRWDNFSKEEIMLLRKGHRWDKIGLAKEIEVEYYKRLRADKLDFNIKNGIDWNKVATNCPLISTGYGEAWEKSTPVPFPERFWNIVAALEIDWDLSKSCFFHSSKFLVVGESDGKEVLLTKDGRYSNSSDYLFIQDFKIICASRTQRGLEWTWYRHLANNGILPEELIGELLLHPKQAVRKAAKDLIEVNEKKKRAFYVGAERI